MNSSISRAINSPLTQFNSLVTDVRQITSVYKHFNSQSLDDLLRWQWTLIVSALDKYIHDIIFVGLVMTKNKVITPTAAYLSFHIPLSVFENPDSQNDDFEQFITQKLSYSSFQAPSKINEGLSLIWNEDHKWQIIASNLNEEQRKVKTTLNLIVQRRNQIVHQGDYSSRNLEKDNIFLSEVEDVVDFIENLVNEIHRELIKDFENREVE